MKDLIQVVDEMANDVPLMLDWLQDKILDLTPEANEALNEANKILGNE